MSLKKRKAFQDLLLNIIGAAIPIGLLQLAILPSIASSMSSEAYGFALTIISFFSMCPAALGNSLNNIRLIRERDYEKANIKGDFPILFLILVFLCISATTFFLLAYGQHTDPSFFIILITSIMYLAQAYYITAYLIQIDYGKVFLNQIFLALGYIAGLGIYHLGGPWEIIYFAGQLFSLIHLFLTTAIWREPLVRTPFFTETAKDTFYITVATGLSRFIGYADRILLFPLLGGALVSVYYVSTLFGKILSMIVGPVSNVVLTYLSRHSKKTDALFGTALVSGLVVCIFGYFLVVILSYPALSVLYPQFVNEAMPYIYINTAAAFISALFSLMSPFILKFFSIKWQICISLVTSVLYIVLALFLVKSFGLWGFCIAVLFVNIVQFFMVIFIYRFAHEK